MKYLLSSALRLKQKLIRIILTQAMVHFSGKELRCSDINAVYYKHTFKLTVSACSPSWSIHPLITACHKFSCMGAVCSLAGQLFSSTSTPRRLQYSKPFCSESTHRFLVEWAINMPEPACPLHFDHWASTFASCRTSNVKLIYLPSSYWEKHPGWPTLYLQIGPEGQRTDLAAFQPSERSFVVQNSSYLNFDEVSQSII